MTESAIYEGASPAAIQQHYDVGNDFYALWLDPTLCYSSAMWDGERDTLQAAQQRKLDFAICGSRAPRTRRVLDIGCGWGAMLHRLTDTHGVEHAVGLTLSQAQACHVRDRKNDRVDVHVQNWIDHQPDATYDAIVSVGAFEHFADMGMTRAERIEAYREFYSHCASWLPAGGRLALETTIKGNNTQMSRSTVRELLFIIDHIFSESEIPWLSEIVEAAEKQFDPIAITNSPHDYARTCDEWRRQLVENRHRATELVGPDTVSSYERYLAASVDAFDNRHLGLAWLIFERI